MRMKFVIEEFKGICLIKNFALMVEGNKVVEK